MADIIDFRVKNGLLVTTTATIEGTNQSTSSSTGALVVTGGVGIGKDLYVGGAVYGNPLYSNSALVLTTATLDQYGVSSLIAGTDTAVSTATGAVTVWATSTLQSVTARGATTNQAISITNATASTSSTTGALTVTGGVGIQGNLNIGGTVTVSGGITGAITTATHLAGGTNGQIPYQITVGRTGFIGAGVTGNLLVSRGGGVPAFLATGAAGRIFTSNGSGADPSWNETLTLDGITDSTSTSSGTLIVKGGVGINRSVFIGGNNNVAGNEIVTGDLTVNGGDIQTNQTTFNLINTTATTVNFAGAGTNITIAATGSGSTTVRNRFTVTDTTNATSTITGALHVKGGAGIQQDVFIGGKVVVEKLDASTGTVSNNALYVAGGLGVGRSLFVTGPAIFNDNVIFAGTSTYVYSTNTVYTDNILNMHAPAGSTGTNHSWAVDDGKDIGFAFHYYNGVDKDAFLGLANDTKYLEWYDNGTETLGGGTFTGTSYGIFKTGGIRLVHTTASVSTTTGALVVEGGVGVGGSLFVGGSVTVAGTINASVTGIITTATNLQGGSAGQVPYQTGIGLTGFTSVGTAGTILTSNGTSAPTWNNTLILDGITESTTTATGALQVRGGVGINRSLNVGQSVAINGTTQATSTTTGALTVAGGAGIRGNIWLGGVLNFHPDASDVASISSTSSANATFFNFNLGDDPGQTDTWRWRFTPSGANEFSAMELDVTSTTTAILTVTGDIAGTNIVASGDISVNGGDLYTNQTTFNLLNSTATTINFGGASTVMNVGANAAGYVLIQNNSDATTTATGALRINGGVGINRSVFIGGNNNVAGNEVITGNAVVNGGNIQTNQTTFNLLNTTATTVNAFGAGTAITIGAQSGTTTVRNNTVVEISTEATSTATGALIVRGGVGVNRDVWIGQRLNVGSDAIITGDVSINGGDLLTSQTTFNLLNTTATTVNAFGAGTAITIGATTGATTIRNNTTITSITAASSTATGALQVRGGVGIGGDLYVGGTINGNVAGSTNNANAVRTTATSSATSYFLTFVDSNNATADYEAVYTDAGIQYNPSSNDLLLAGDLQIQGGDLTTNQPTFNLLNSTATTINFGGASTAMTVGANAAGFVLVQNNSDATSTATGALRVNGGVGVNRDVWVGQRLNVGSDAIITGDLAINGGDLQTSQTTFNLLNTTATTINFGGASTVMNVGAAGAGYVQIRNNSAAGSTSSGALRVDGGVGINGSLYAGNIFTNGSQVIPFKMEEFTASASQTTFTVTGGYVVGTVMVFVNGIFMNSGDFTASNGTTVVLNIARNSGDIVKVIAGGTSSAANQSQAFSIAMSVAMSM